ncbi:MAG: hypothetical protein J6A04_00715 [Clostridia bacterium]|nr:hypothetical protein [Clostridia bacterium]
MSIIEQKNIEHTYITKYMKEFHGIIPKYINPKIDIPDGYFIINGQYWAVEAVSYFMDDKEKNSQILRANLNKYNENKNNIFKLCF